MTKKTLAAKVRLQAQIHNVDDGSFQIKLKFRTSEGWGSITVPRSHSERPRELVNELLNNGALMPSSKDAKLTLVQEALESEPRFRRKVTSATGWHEDTFVHPRTTIGAEADRLRFSEPASDGDGLAGSLEEWKAALQPAADASSYLSFALGVGFAGPLLRIADQSEGAIFNFYGQSSTGKTLAGRVAQSVFRRANSNDVATYDITSRALEELCHSRNDLTVVLDEHGRLSGTAADRSRTAQQIAYKIPSGNGRSRSSAATNVRNLRWRCLGLSSSEIPLTPEDGRSRNLGERLRHIDIPIPSIAQQGIFDRLDGLGSASALASTVSAGIRDNYGVALKPLITFIQANEAALRSSVLEKLQQFRTHVGIDAANSWETRFGDKFALVFFALRVAEDAGVAPWSGKHALARVTQVYQAARSAVFQPREEAQRLMITLASLLDEQRFPILEPGTMVPDNWEQQCYGFRRQGTKRYRIVAIRSERFDQLVGAKTRAQPVLKALLELGIAEPGAAGKLRQQIALAGLEGRHRYICLQEEAIIQRA